MLKDPQVLLQERTRALADMRSFVEGVSSFVNEHRDEPRAGLNDFADAPTQDGGDCAADPFGTNEPATCIEGCSELWLQAGGVFDGSMHDVDHTNDAYLAGGAALVPRQCEESCGPNGDSFESENDAPTQDQPMHFNTEAARGVPDGEPTRLIAQRRRR